MIAGVDTDELENLPDEEYDEEVVEFLLKVEETILDEEQSTQTIPRHVNHRERTLTVSTVVLLFWSQDI